jgi:E3 ubiquitin-protein ligase BRE1
MMEYKRQCNTLEKRLEEMKKRANHHDDHIRIVDSWWIQLLQELNLLAENKIPYQPDVDQPPFPTHTSFQDLQDFESQLSEKASSIKSITESLLTRCASSRGQVLPSVTNLESQVNSLLAYQKDFLVKLDRLSSDKDQVSEQLDLATLRYMKAERKVDRLRSTQVHKLEQQALAHATTRPSAGPEAENGKVAGEVNGNIEALQAQLQETNAVSEKQKEQLEAALSESKSLREELTAVQTKLSNLTDEDYSRTELFKAVRAQQEETVKKVNHLDVTNKRLQEDRLRLENERESYKKKLEEEAQSLTTELEDQLQTVDSDLVRVRSARDELHGEVTKLRTKEEQVRTAIDHMKELVSAKEDRISALELEVRRLQPSEDVDMDPRPDIEEIPLDELREKYKKLQQDFESVNKELPAMAAAIKRSQALASKKVMDFDALEERLQITLAEKSKANQKYFDARKHSDTMSEEIKRLRGQNSKSSEIISQLKDNEAQNRTLLGNLEKQLSDLKQTNTAIMTENRRLELACSDALRRLDSLKTQVSELHSLARSKDSTTAVARERHAALETEAEKLKVRIDYISKDRDKWKTKSLSNSSDEEEMLRVSTSSPRRCTLR